MPRIGIPELILILLIVLIVFGAGKLPQIGHAVGKSIHEFRKSQHGEEEDKSGAKKAQSGDAGDTARK